MANARALDWSKQVSVNHNSQTYVPSCKPNTVSPFPIDKSSSLRDISRHPDPLGFLFLLTNPKAAWSAVKGWLPPMPAPAPARNMKAVEYEFGVLRLNIVKRPAAIALRAVPATIYGI